MPILDQFGREMILTPQNSTFANPDTWFLDEYCEPQSSAGVRVSNTSAMRVSAVFACIRNISDDVAKLPLKLYERMDRGKKTATSNPLYKILHDMPNPEMSSFHFRQYLTQCACGPGNGYAEIVRNAGGQVTALYPICHTWVTTKRDEELGIYHEVRPPSGPTVYLPDRDMLHIHGPGDGVVGWSMIRLARESIGNAIAIDKATGASIGNDSTPGGVLSLPPGTKLDDKARENLRKEWEAIHRGAENRRRTAVLEGGVTFQAVSFTPDDMQFIERAQHSVEDIARWWRMPPHKIGHLLRATNNNIEHQALEYVQDCLSTWLVVWEQEIARKLFPANNTKLFAEFLVEGLLRGDQASRGAFYNMRLQMGTITPNEIREKENDNAGGEELDKFYMQSNMAPLDLIAEGVAFKQSKETKGGSEETNPTSQETTTKTPENRIAPVVRAVKPVIADALRRCLKQSAANVSAASKKPGFAQWRADFFDALPDSVTATLEPPCKALATAVWATVSPESLPQTTETVITGAIGDFARLHVSLCEQESRDMELVKSWTQERAEREADDACNRVVAALGIKEMT